MLIISLLILLDFPFTLSAINCNSDSFIPHLRHNVFFSCLVTWAVSAGTEWSRSGVSLACLVSSLKVK